MWRASGGRHTVPAGPWGVLEEHQCPGGSWRDIGKVQRGEWTVDRCVVCYECVPLLTAAIRQFDHDRTSAAVARRDAGQNGGVITIPILQASGESSCDRTGTVGRVHAISPGLSRTGLWRRAWWEPARVAVCGYR